ncbi:hypothetical protein BRADI_2g56806v3 [Brachypodium distachyon]|uniref:Uncharacterized protein n=1 Tax=Brachypodium distachyon TaxID=15368 RepID=A0A2K2DGA6_BRADI|nr:hypothetical protein BRADI_2g56806v3 [Brachypodium distachyon]
MCGRLASRFTARSRLANNDWGQQRIHRRSSSGISNEWRDDKFEASASLFLVVAARGQDVHTVGLRAGGRALDPAECDPGRETKQPLAAV